MSAKSMRSALCVSSVFHHPYSMIVVSILLCMYTSSTLAMDVYFAQPQIFSINANQVSSSLKVKTEKILQTDIETISSTVAGSIVGDSLIIAIGPEALNEVLKGPGNAPLISVFVSKGSFESITAKAKPYKRKISAIYSDPDPVKQIALSKAIFGEQAKGVLVRSPSSEPYIENYISAANSFNVNLTVVDIKNINSSKSFIETTRSNQILFLIKDSNLFEAVPLDKILLSSYEINRQATIGYSKGIVNNGGAGTTYSSLNDIAKSIAQQFNNLQNSKNLNPPDFTETYQVNINKYILRSLDVNAIDESSAHHKVLTIIQRGDKK